MKKSIVLAIAAIGMLSASVMASCLHDQDRIQAQINQHGSIVTNADYKDGILPVVITEIDSAHTASDNPSVCLAFGDYNVYVVGWLKGDWSDSIIAESSNTAKASLAHVAGLVAKTRK